MKTTKANAIIALSDLDVTIDKGIIVLSKLGGYKGDFDLQSKAIDLFKFYKKCTSTTYVQIVNSMFTTPLTDKIVTKLEKLSTEISAEEKIYDDIFREAQLAFAKKHGFTLSEN
jgi:hypothetical protein